MLENFRGSRKLVRGCNYGQHKISSSQARQVRKGSATPTPRINLIF
jgi:hypothetical protein